MKIIVARDSTSASRSDLQRTASVSPVWFCVRPIKLALSGTPRADRLQIHFLPKYAPETDPIERVW